mmetsp:Transcript_1573/g.4294  ORF Transcript_1573/g.4294 Transcript_1573/m.4294 type:complete len:244 (+) Transcript_1573:1466-2197(+)
MGGHVACIDGRRSLNPTNKSLPLLYREAIHAPLPGNSLPTSEPGHLPQSAVRYILEVPPDPNPAIGATITHGSYTSPAAAKRCVRSSLMLFLMLASWASFCCISCLVVGSNNTIITGSSSSLSQVGATLRFFEAPALRSLLKAPKRRESSTTWWSRLSITLSHHDTGSSSISFCTAPASLSAPPLILIVMCLTVKPLACWSSTRAGFSRSRNDNTPMLAAGSDLVKLSMIRSITIRAWFCMSR